MTSSREVHGGMWVSSSSPTPACAAARPASVPDICKLGGRAGRCVHAPRTGKRRRRGPDRSRIAVAGVAAVHQRRTRRIGDPHPVGLGRMAHQLRRHRANRSAPPRRRPNAGCRMSEQSSISPPRATTPPHAPRVRRAVHEARPRGRRMIAPPHEQAGQVQAMIGMQMREQLMYRVRVGMALHAPSTPPPKSMTPVVCQAPSARVAEAGDSGPTTLPEQPSTVIRTLTACHAP